MAARWFWAIVLALVVIPGCIKLDFFLFDGDPAEAVASDYHGLPLYLGDDRPAWVDDALVEREVYLAVPSGAVIPKERLGLYEQYIHGAFLAAPALCATGTCPLIADPVTFLYTHGNSGDLFRYWYRAVALWNMGANVFIFTYRGYGMSKGATSRAHIKVDADAAASYLKGRADVDPARIVLYGYSMGAITAGYLAGASPHRNTFAGVILESGLDSPEEVVQLSTGTEFPGGFFLDDEPFNGPLFIVGTTMPILHFHGGRDLRVIIDQSYNYYEVLKARGNYTHFIGKPGESGGDWLREVGHRNALIAAFDAEEQISDYWDDGTNPAHCCVHPDEYADPKFAGFLRDVGKTDGNAMLSSAEQYEDLVTTWVGSILP